MEIIDPGHTYKLNVLDGDSESLLIFVKREGETYPGNIGHYSGTTCQEVIRALIDRMQYLDNQIPSWENKISRFCLLIALWCFEFRHARRKGRALWILPHQIYKESVCSRCGHVRCIEH